MTVKPQEGTSFSIESQYIDTPPTPPVPDPNAKPQTSEPETPTTPPANDADFLTPEFAQELGGSKFDNNGNLINDRGTIILAASRVKDAIAEAKAKQTNPDGGESNDENDEGNLVINADGDLVNEAGEIVRKKGTFTFNEKTGEVVYEEEPLVKSLAESFKSRGYKLTDDQGNPLEFEDSEEGLEQFVAALGSEYFNNLQEEFITSYPELQSLYEHLSNGGDPYEYYRQRANVTDYTKVNIPAENQAGRLNLIRSYFTELKKLTEEEADTMLEAIKATGKVDDRYTAALNELKASQEAKVAAEAADRKARADAQIEAARKYWGDVQKTVTSGKIGNFQIPEKDRTEFYNFLATPDKDGMTPYQKAMSEMSLDMQLALQYQVFKKMDLDSLVRIRVNTEKADALRNRSQKVTKVVSGGTPRFQKSEGTPDGLNITNII